MLSSRVQTFLTKKVSDFLKNEYGITISIGRINFRPINAIILDKIYIEDFYGDTLIYVDHLDAGINRIGFKGPVLAFNHMQLDSVKYYMLTDSTGTSNLNRFLTLFESSDTLVKESSGFRLYAHNVNVSAAEVKIQGYNPEQTPEMNFNDLQFSKTNIAIKSLDIIGGDVYIDIQSLSTIEKCGMKVDNLSANFAYDSDGIKLEQLDFKTGKTNISTNFLRMLYLTNDPFEDFITNVAFDADFLQSTVSTDDLAFIVTDIDTLNIDVILEGIVKGPLNNLSAKNLSIKTGETTNISTTLNVKNLLNIDKLYIDASIKDFYTTYTDLNNFDFLKNREGISFLPEELSAFEKIRYKGNIKGSLSDFTTSSTFITNIGTILLDGKVQQSPEHNYNIQGILTASNLDIAAILRTNEQNADLANMLGLFNGRINVNSTFLSNNTFMAQLKANITSVDFYQYNYQNIDINGLITDKFFEGDLEIDDPNIALDFTGKIEYGTKELKHRFILNLPRLNLYNLDLDSDSLSFAQFDMVADMSGLNLDEINGKIQLYDTYVKRKGEDVYFPSLNIDIEQSLSTKKIQVNSDFFDISLAGQYSYSTISDVINEIVKTYIPRMAWSDNEVAPNDSTNINIKIKLVDIQPVVNLFDPALRISNNSLFDINYAAPTKQLNMKGSLLQAAYGNITLDTIEINGYNQRRRIVANIGAKRFNYIEGQSLKNFSVSSIIEDNNIILSTTWNNYNQNEAVNYSGFINAQLNLPEDSINNKLYIDVLPSYAVISDITWEIEPSTIEITDSLIDIKNFAIHHRTQYLEVNGKISVNEEDTLSLKANGINIDLLNILLQNEIDLKVGGTLTADVSATKVLDNPFLLAQIQLDSLRINNQLIGNTTISSNWDPLLEAVHIDWVSTVHDYNVLYIVGDYDPFNYNMNFRLFIDRFDLSILNPYMKGILHDLSGLTTAEVIVKGKLADPKIEGVIILDRATFIVDYTQTRYQITDWIDVSPNEFIFNDLRIVDVNNNYTLLTGKVQHQNFENIMLDINFSSRNFMFLNTLEKDNNTFFGTIFVSGNGNLKGTFDLLDISLNIKTEPNTRIFIPLNSGNTVSTIDYITFVEPTAQNAYSSNLINEQTASSPTSINLSMNLEVTPEAEVQLIFDPTIGDIIKAKGSSNLNVFLYPSGIFEIYGDYIISDGDYLFTLQDVFQKRFDIAKGSSITWSGDPTSANIDIDAVYKVRRASLYELTFNQEDEEVRLSADAHLLMTGTFKEPKINFKVSLPTSAEQAQEQLDVLSRDEISKQVISLLVLGRFQPLPGTSKQTDASTSGVVGSNASELLSNQVSNWLSQISRSFDIGFNYTPGGETTTQEYELAVSTQILNNRITINGSAGMGGQQANSSNSSNVVGDVEMEVKLDKRGRIRFKGYTKSDDNTEADTKQGASIFYREEFNTFKDLWQKFFKKSKKNP